MPKDNSHIFHQFREPGQTYCGAYTGSTRVKFVTDWTKATCDRCLKSRPETIETLKSQLRAAIVADDWDRVDKLLDVKHPKVKYLTLQEAFGHLTVSRGTREGA
jgi:hypothetical protein